MKWVRWVFYTGLFAGLASGCGGESSGSADSASTGSGGGDSTDGGSTSASAPRGNVAFNIAGCASYSAGVGADPDADAQTKITQLPATDGTRPGRRVEDGQEGVSVSCGVSGNDPLELDLTIRGTQSHPAAALAEIVGMDLSGTLSGVSGTADISLRTGAITYRSSTPCTLSLDSDRDDNQFAVDGGRIYARFDCPEMTDPPTTGCFASGAFVFERCDE